MQLSVRFRLSCVCDGVCAIAEHLHNYAIEAAALRVPFASTPRVLRASCAVRQRHHSPPLPFTHTHTDKHPPPLPHSLERILSQPLPFTRTHTHTCPSRRRDARTSLSLSSRGTHTQTSTRCRGERRKKRESGETLLSKRERGREGLYHAHRAAEAHKHTRTHAQTVVNAHTVQTHAHTHTPTSLSEGRENANDLVQGEEGWHFTPERNEASKTQTPPSPRSSVRATKGMTDSWRGTSVLPHRRAPAPRRLHSSPPSSSTESPNPVPPQPTSFVSLHWRRVDKATRVPPTYAQTETRRHAHTRTFNRLAA